MLRYLVLAGCDGMATAMAEPKTFSTRDFRLQSGVVMPSVTIAYATLGRLRRIAATPCW